MPDLEIKRKVQLSREEVAARLITIARALAEQPVSHLELDGDSIELKWKDGGLP